LINDAYAITPEWTGVVQAEAMGEEQRRSEIKGVVVVVVEYLPIKTNVLAVEMAVELAAVIVAAFIVAAVIVVIAVALCHSGSGSESHQQNRHTGYRENQSDTSHNVTSLVKRPAAGRLVLAIPDGLLIVPSMAPLPKGSVRGG
jgi:hypothetical protein